MAASSTTAAVSSGLRCLLGSPSWVRFLARTAARASSLHYSTCLGETHPAWWLSVHPPPRILAPGGDLLGVECPCLAAGGGWQAGPRSLVSPLSLLEPLRPEDFPGLSRYRNLFWRSWQPRVSSRPFPGNPCILASKQPDALRVLCGAC